MSGPKSITDRVGEDLSSVFEPVPRHEKRGELRRARQRAEIARIRSGTVHSGFALLFIGLFVTFGVWLTTDLRPGWKPLLLLMGIVTVAVGAIHIDLGARARNRFIRKRRILGAPTRWWLVHLHKYDRSKQR